MKYKNQIQATRIFLSITFCICVIQGIAQWNPNYSIGTVSGKYAFSYTQTPEQLVQIYAPLYGTGIISYQWEQSTSPLTDFGPISGATQSIFTFSAPLTQTTYYRQKAIDNTGDYVYSNTVKIAVVSKGWEDKNYIREHDIFIPGIETWVEADQLQIGDKLQTTTYLDGLGRSVEQVSRETATPSSGSLWGDIVQFSEYDAFGREPKNFLPYSTFNASESGKFKSSPDKEQESYYDAVYNETSPFSQVSFEDNPLSRVQNIKSPGKSWAEGLGNSAVYELNGEGDDVKVLSIDYYSGAVPRSDRRYAVNTLYKTIQTNENGKLIITYTNMAGQLILRKVQLDNEPEGPYQGWICTYNVYDDFGLLRYVLQPEAVKYLSDHEWTFHSEDGLKVLDQLCFRYEYDAKGRNVLKKAPGAEPLNMLYDDRDRLVFMQDGNQAHKSIPEWTVNLYDDLDRLTISTLYNTSATIDQIKEQIANAAITSTVTTSADGGPVNDLILNNRNASISIYAARNSISFVDDDGDNFSSVIDDDFTADIDENAVAPPLTISTTLYRNPLSNTELNDPSVCTVLKYEFYDNYQFEGVKSFENGFKNKEAYNPGEYPAVLQIATSQRVISFSTGSMVRVLGTTTFLKSTRYYDEKGNTIQVIEDNILAGKDITTMQYHFDGREMSVESRHSTNNTGYSDFRILTKNIFDKIGRIVSIQKRYGGNEFKTITIYTYDDMGRLKTKRLDPGYTPPGTTKQEMESLTYSYNIHNQITGINKDYALNLNNENKWQHFFGLYLGYDNQDHLFRTKQLDGHVTGTLWATQGEYVQRKYDFQYDNAGRLINAFFKERADASKEWDNSKMDFSVSSSYGKITYDLNGNLLNMQQRGVMPGLEAPVSIDELQYEYARLSNKLIKVTDRTPLTGTNGQSGDFKDGSNGETDDYVYDYNGNLVTDLNKDIRRLEGEGDNGISYNYLDKPEKIQIEGKGIIQIVYDADGNKLQKIFTPRDESKAVVTTYINAFVYQQKPAAEGETGPPVKLQYINFEEGRIRVIQPVNASNGYDALIIDGSMALPNDKEGVYDFFIRDYQQNIRMIVTEETHWGSNKCSMEVERAGAEEPIFGQEGGNNEVANTRFVVDNIPGQSSGNGWQNTAIGNYVSKLGNTGFGLAKTGPNTLQKVMAGDVISATTQYYYQNTVNNTGGGDNLTEDVLTSLLLALSGSSSTAPLVKEQSAAINAQLAIDPAFSEITDPDAANTSGTNPKAYLTIMFFDERFKYISESSSFIRVEDEAAGQNNLSLTLANIKAPKNGYVYVYISNESDEAVYFDNLNVSLNRGRIVEEDHYYAYGLKIAAISSQKLGDINEGHLDNQNLYNDKELFEDGGLDWYDYGFRNYDAQIGRFVQLDPITWEYPELTNYQYASCEPIANVDRDGLESEVANVGTKVAEEMLHNGAATPLAEVIVSNGPKTRVGKLLRFINKQVLPRIGGALKATVGTAIMSFGFLTAEIGIGVPIIAFGADYTLSGLEQVWDAKSHPTLTQTVLESIGVSPANAEFVVEGAAIYFSMGTAAIEQAANKGVGNVVKVAPKKVESVPNENVPPPSKPYAKNRPSYADGQVEKVYENARQPDGNVYDPHTGDPLPWDKTRSRNGQWDMGHVNGQKYSDVHSDYMQGQMTTEEFRKWYQDPAHYRPELPKNNRSHIYEHR